MSYVGETAIIKCDRGGFANNPNTDMIAPELMILPTRNLNLHENGRKSRGGTATVHTVASAAQITGVYGFRLRSGTRKVVTSTIGGDVYNGASTVIKASMSTATFFDFETFQNTLFIADGKTTPQTWDGAAGATAAVTSLPTDWTGANFPQWFVKHGSGNSERLWAGGCATGPHTIYASANGDGNDFSDANVITINIETGDGYGIVGAAEFGDKLICFSKRKAYVIDDADVNTSNWGYQEAQWQGGAGNFRLIVRIPNDLIVMDEAGDIYSVITAQQYGDYKVASLSRPAFIDKWIRDNVAVASIEKFHGVYDPNLRAVKFFVIRSGQSNVDTAIVYFIDRPPEEAWMIHDNQAYGSGYSASASSSVHVSDGVITVYTGDYSGVVWKLEQTDKNDNSAAYSAGFRTPYMNFGDARTTKRFQRGIIVAKPQGSYSLTVDMWVDGTQLTSGSVDLTGEGGLLGSFTLGTSLLGGANDLIEKEFDIAGKGNRLMLEVYNNTIDQPFFISSIMIDYKPLGKEPT